MEYLFEFFKVYWMYCQELWLTLAIGFLISGIFYKIIPTNFVEQHLGDPGIKPIFIASFIGTLLPVCCIGSLPIAITLRRKGAALGAVLSFLVATPATSVSALIVCWKLMGGYFTVYIFVAILLMSLLIGVVINRLKFSENLIKHMNNSQSACCHESATDEPVSTPIRKKIMDVLKYAYIVLPKEIGMEILVGIALASLIVICAPLQDFIRHYLVGATGYAFILAMGLLTYVCSTASVPMADALVQSGMSLGQAMCYLLIGPITSYGTILVIKKDFGGRILGVYLLIITGMSLLFGLLYDVLIGI